MDTAASPAAIRLDVTNGIAVLTLNRPEVRNAIDDAMRSQMIAALERVTADTTIRALVVTGAGAAFCSGGDVRGMYQRLSVSPEHIAMNGWRRQQNTHRAMSLLHLLPKPTIAAVNGAAAGLGCDVALACDLILASPAASFTMSFIARGLVPDGGGMYFLPRRVGLARAKDLVFSGRTVTAEEALTIGLADRIVSAGALLDTAIDWASELSSGSCSALALAKGVLDRSLESTFEQVMSAGSQAQAICYTTEEHRASVEAFLARSKTHGVSQQSPNRPKSGS